MITVSKQSLGQNQPAKESIAELEGRVDQFVSQGNYADAVSLLKSWLHANQGVIKQLDRISLERELASNQLMDDQANDSVETFRNVIKTMKENPAEFPEWTVRTVQADLSQAERLVPLSSHQRKRLFRSRSRLQNLKSGLAPEDANKVVGSISAADAKDLLLEELKAVQSILGDKPPNILSTELQEQLGLELIELKQWTAAEAEFNAAIHARSFLYGEQHPNTAQVRGMLALTLSHPLRPDALFDEALGQYEAAIATFESTLGANADATLSHLSDAAIRCLAIHRTEMALEYSAKLLKRVREAYPGDRKRLIQATDAVALNARRTGNLPVAEFLYADLERSLRETGKEFKWREAAIALGQVQAEIGNFHQAIQLFEEVLKECEGNSESESQKASCLIPLAHCHLRCERPNAASECLDRAEKIVMASPPSELTLVYHLERSRLQIMRKDLQGAQSSLELALAVRPTNEVISVTLPLRVNAMKMLHQIEFELGRPAEAIRRLEEALDVCRKHLGDQHPSTVELFCSLGTGQLKLGETEPARKNLAAGLGGLIDNANSFRLIAESETLRQLSKINQTRDLLFSAMRLHGKLQAAEFYEHSWRSKGVLTNYSRGRFEIAASDSELQEQMRSLREVKLKISNLLWAPDVSSQTLDETRQKEIRQEMTLLSAQKKQLESRLAFRPSPSKKAAHATPTKLANVLPKNVAVVDFILTRQFAATPSLNTEKIFYEAYILRSREDGSRLEVNRIELGTQRALGPYLLRWREAISRIRAYSKPVTEIEDLPQDADAVERLAAISDDQICGEVGDLIRKVVWERIEPFLDGIDTVVILPDVDFDRIPWYVLPGRKPDTNLIDDYAICTALNGEHLVELLTTSVGKSQGCLFVSNLHYGKGRQGARESAHEVPNIRSLKSVPMPQLWLQGPHARLDRLIEEMPKWRFQHYSTHGKYATSVFPFAFSPDSMEKKDLIAPFDPDALFADKLRFLATRRSGQISSRKTQMNAVEFVIEESPLSCGVLALSESSGKTSPWDQADMLSGEMIASLNLNAVDLVVLSACETNRGPALIGEGTLCLQRAFQLAGARSVVGSLWIVEARATADLMALFYRNLWEHRMTKIESLRAAQRTMRDHFNQKDWDHRNPDAMQPLAPENRTPPRLWAQFMLSGDWGS